MIHTYIASIKNLPDPKTDGQHLLLLDENRRKKTLRFLREESRKQSLGAGLLLQKALKRHGFENSKITFSKNGKPKTDGVCFNLSHSGEFVVCSIGEKDVGCDIEKAEKERLAVANRFFTKNENAYLDSFEGEEKKREFFRLWTLKESYMKLTGEGFSLSLSDFEISVDNGIFLMRDNKKCDVCFKEFQTEGYALSVCSYDGEFSPLEWIEF